MQLEKEAISKGVPLRQALDIEIPPPRPKRKPSFPYPRKTSAGTPSSSPSADKDRKRLKSASSMCSSKQVLDLENNLHPEKLAGKENLETVRESLSEDNSLGIITLFQEASCSFISSADKISLTHVSRENPLVFNEFIPLVKEISDQGATAESYVTVKAKRVLKLNMIDTHDTDLDNGTGGSENLSDCARKSQGTLVQQDIKDKLKQPKNLGASLKEETQINQNYPKHVPLHVVEKTPGICVQTINQAGRIQGNLNSITNSTVSATAETHSNISMSSLQQPLPNLPPHLTHPLYNDQDTYRSVHNISSPFTNLIISTLLQNPAAHAAASLAASFWPYTNVENSADYSEDAVREFSSRHMSSSRSMAALAATTIAAASAWWATHGMLPLPPPLNIGFNYIPVPTSATPTNPDPTPLTNREMKDTSPRNPPCKGQELDPEVSETLKMQHSDSKYPPQTPSDSEEFAVVRSNETEPNTSVYKQKPLAVTDGFHDSEKGNTRGQVDRSSCGSNTASSSEVETDALEKHEQGNEDLKELPDAIQQGIELNSYRCRSSSNSMYEPWKEVSEEGRMAFQALFARDVLPQSFPLLHEYGRLENSNQEEEKHKSGENNNGKDRLELDLNINTSLNNLDHHRGLLEKGKLPTELGHEKLKVARRTGFKPYKRCSVEAQLIERGSNSNSQCVEERGPKRLRLEGETSL
ncbi:hypothetical protein GIB67_001655 [Kingdonia uniflora]|uniref:Uncharacterized protein n=1 Tax=Kingdonia uniflora TaxID=39325 RepID=A0A7J7L0U9_9MAGN|nr:hypothetical protein GIB67_001655 [Kingdonia uniflora]